MFMLLSNWLARPAHLLLFRFISRGLLVAAIILLVAVSVLTRLERENYLRHITETAQERVTRLSEHFTHQTLNPSRATPLLEGTSQLQALVAQETLDNGLLRLDVVNSQGVIVASSAVTQVGILSTAPEVAEARASQRIINQVMEGEGNSFLHFATPLQMGAETYVVLVDQPLTSMDVLTQNSRNAIVLTLTLGFILMFGLLGVVVYRAGLEIEHHQTAHQHIKTVLERYVSPAVATQILAQGALHTSGERRLVTILFVDIRGFTATAERLPPERVVALLNDYLAAMTEAVFQHGGTVDKFLGDGLMAVFGAPLAYPDHAQRAFACASDMQAAFRQLQKRWQAQGVLRLGLGIGLSTGEVIVGNIGSNQRLDYTAIGDTVNTAQRLQSMATDSQVLLSATTQIHLTNTPLEPLGFQKLKGKREAVEVFRWQPELD